MKTTRKGLGKGKGSGYYNIIPTYDSHIHSLSARGVKSCLPKQLKLKLNAKTYSYKLFQLDNNYSISCHTEDTRTGFRHIAVLLQNGVEVDRDKSVYYNRTWESYEYESVIHSLITKHFPADQAKVFIAKADGKPIRTDLAGNVYAKGKKNPVNSRNLVGYIMEYEGGNLTSDDTLYLFSHLIKTGKAWTLQGSYGRMAQGFIDNGYIDDKGKINWYNASNFYAKGKKLDAMTFDLAPRYDSRKSFYGKARVEQTDDGRLVLYSYNTKVAEIVNGVPVVYGTYSPTTSRHIKEFLKQQGFKAETGKQIIKDYGEKKRRDLAGNLYGKKLDGKKEEIGMGVYDKETNELVDFGYYASEEEARKDFENYDKPKGRYAKLQDGTIWLEAKEILNDYEIKR